MSLSDICASVYALVVELGPDMGDITERCEELDATLGEPRETPRLDRAMIAAAMGGA